jgi:hypothetical protein
MSNTGQILGDIGATINDNLNCWEVLANDIFVKESA